MLTKIILNVPYKDKDLVKQLGAKWDPQEKTWFIPPGKNSACFNSWLIKPSNKPNLIVNGIGVLRNIVACWSCKGYCTIYGIYVKSIILDSVIDPSDPSIEAEKKILTGFFILSEISLLPDNLKEFLILRCPNFRLGKASTDGKRLYRNHCDHCKIGFSDNRLHKKGQGFNPHKPFATKTIQFIDLLFFDNLKISSDYVDYSENKISLEQVTSDYLLDFI